MTSSLSGAGATYPRLTSEERRHVEPGATLVTTRPNDDGTHAVFIVCLLDPTSPGAGVIVGKVNPEYLWGGDGFLTPSVELCVLGQAGETLFASMPDGVPSAPLKEALAATGPTGRFEWSHENERYVAGYWTLFMRPAYLASWTLTQSERLDDVQQPLRSFAWTFLLIVLCTFWVVTFLSLRQIRRRMVPIDQLLDATQKLKAKDFSHRVRIASDDEFAELGTAFNDMTESMGVHLSVMNTINGIGVSLSAEKDEARLLETVLRGAQAVFNADGAALFLLSNDDRLELSLAHVKSLSLWVRGPAAARRGPRHRAGCTPRPAPTKFLAAPHAADGVVRAARDSAAARPPSKAGATGGRASIRYCRCSSTSRLCTTSRPFCSIACENGW